MKPILSSLTNSPEILSIKNCNSFERKSKFSLQEEKYSSSLSPQAKKVEFMSPLNKSKIVQSNKKNLKIINFNEAYQNVSPISFDSHGTIRVRKCATNKKEKELKENLVKEINFKHQKYSTPSSRLSRHTVQKRQCEFDLNFSKLHNQFRQCKLENNATDINITKEKERSGKVNKKNKKGIKKSISMKDFLLFNRASPSRSRSQIEFSDLLLKDLNTEKNQANSLHISHSNDHLLTDKREIRNYYNLNIINEILSPSKIRKCQSV